jgi:hypothetical protein
MPDIRYVCLSDMHLGAENSLLTNLKSASSETEPLQPSPVLEQLVACLRGLTATNEGTELPTLILNGDILELALATDNEAAMAFERFIELIWPKGSPLFRKIVYIPGNHDDHLWEVARETQYTTYLAGLVPGSSLPPPWHATKMFDPDPVPSTLLTQVMRRFGHLKNEGIDTVYPNLGLLDSTG